MVSIAFTGGGTGGHIYPGLAVASWIQKTFLCRIFWIGSGAGMDRAIVESTGVEFFGIPSGKLRRYFSLHNFLDVFKILAGVTAAWRILKRERPVLLFSKGGFVSVPPCAAAKFLKIPVFAHESDYSPGLATRINTRFAGKIFVPYSESAAFFPPAVRERICVSGNPIRSEFSEADPSKGRSFLSLGDDERILLVLGGSLGSREINALVRASLPELTKNYTVVHQCGDDPKIIKNPIARYKPYAYFKDEISHVIAASELILCRSGAGTIWECKSLNKPMVLIPFRGSGTRGDQVENARLFEEAGAAICFIPDESMEESAIAKKLSALIASLAEDHDRRRLMAEANIAQMNATAYIAEEIMRKINAL
ncbi:MAG: UDP-N-acetylglucosamine--N-acetylmuramyl-(pentapeptide) pyrophosphoryl-undecaprenol N-acetylglucosamine transferase [Treponema sp.]|jgi:UDP-N-acetylglucosamine--N-acetylmuramyl-(pentapeptide) pyrophosphoryl-undecaprenol N-acetylglucosamine transferase|nr:UDP-N-acetylglucosamine--N-acetylmuramyl-(pentapeptide) pyrophosphoryl-undecaprenol N-acetylglucosamine transferase [Treponema sp.]